MSYGRFVQTGPTEWKWVIGDETNGSPLTQLLTEVGRRIEDLEKTVKAREIQLLDALDEVKALRGQVQERDEMISDLQQMVSRAVEAAE